LLLELLLLKRLLLCEELCPLQRGGLAFGGLAPSRELRGSLLAQRPSLERLLLQSLLPRLPLVGGVGAGRLRFLSAERGDLRR